MEGSPKIDSANLADWLGEDILTEITNHYTVRRQSWGFEIFACQYLNGPRVGVFTAIPRIGSITAHERFWGAGDTTPLALADCLRKSHKAPYELMFPRAEST